MLDLCLRLTEEVGGTLHPDAVLPAPYVLVVLFRASIADRVRIAHASVALH
jgi:hypothetical protein